jgi:plasmid stabilization system protein ParE
MNALRQLAAIRRHVALDKPGAATKLTYRIKTSADSLANFPLSGRVGRVPGTREWVIPGTPYIVSYTVTESELRILAVHHGETNWKADPDPTE